MFELSMEPVHVEESAEELQAKKATLNDLVLRVEEIVKQRDVLLDGALELQAELREICHKSLVETMQGLGQSEVKLDSGHKVALKVTATARIVEGQEQQAYALLRQHGFGDNIRHSLFVEGVDADVVKLTVAEGMLKGVFEDVARATKVDAKEVSLFMEHCVVEDIELPEGVFGYVSLPQAEVRLGRLTLTKKPKF
jgi:hypothetical protein